jgi:diguanylate cyclase (GGDEF)-like protein
MDIKVQANNKHFIYLIGLLLGISAFILNAFFVANMAGSVPIYFGSAFVLFCLLTLPFHVSILVLCASLAPLLIYDSPLSIGWLHGLQFFVVAILLYYQARFLTVIVLFWLLIGLPITSIIVYINLSLNFQVSVYIALPFVLSGYICGMLALLVFWLLPINSQFNQRQILPKFSKLVFEFNLVSVMLPLFIVVLFFIWRSTNDSLISVSLGLDNAIEELNRSTSGLLNDNVHTLISTAKILSNEDNTQYQATILDTVANATANIESMVVTDKEGTVLFAAPEQYAALLPELSGINISFRKYFELTKKTKEPVVSKAIKGIGLGSLDIVAITAPILTENDFEGLVQAAIKLDRFVDQSVINAIQNGKIAVIVTDAMNSIIYSSPIFGLKKLDRFNKIIGETSYSFTIPKIEISEKDYLYKEFSNQHGWKIYALTEPGRVYKDTNTYFTFMIVIFLQSIMFIAILSKGLASNIVRPLRNLEAFMKGKKLPEKLLIEAKVSQEMLSLTLDVIKTQKLSLDFQRELKEQVEAKTQQLQDLNTQLLKVSRTDALTSLLNRGAFDEIAKDAYTYYKRHTKSFTIAFVDIDHFKNINDTYGHSIGDECLVGVANIIADMCRRETDIISRYGGEEFVLLFASDKPEQHLGHIKLIHKSIGDHKTMYSDKLIQLTASCGVVRVVDDFSKSMLELISLADEQLYLSKDKGRNQVSAVTI